MGRPLNKKYFGNRNIGSSSVTTDDGIGGQGLDVALGGTNNSTGFTNNSTTQATVTAPELPTGVQAVLTVRTHAAGGLTNATTYTRSGTSVAAQGTYTGVVQKSTSGSGTGAVFTITKSTGATTYAAVTVTVTEPGSGYALTNTIVIDGALLGGVTGTNDLTLTVATFVATTGTIKSIDVTEKGSGYTAAPTVTLSTGTVGTLTATATLTANTGGVGSVTYQESAIIAYAGASASKADIVKQVSKDRYKVTTGSTPFIAKLKTSAAANAADEMTIKATDSLGKTYYVQKLTARKAVIVPYGANGHEFPLNSDSTAQSVPWSLSSAVTGTVQIENG